MTDCDACGGALAGRQVSTPSTLWPWQSQRLIVAVPVSDGGAVLGSVLLASPTGGRPQPVLVAWLALGLGGVLAVAACVVTAYWLAGWVLRLVTRLDAAAHDIAAGSTAARVQPGWARPSCAGSRPASTRWRTRWPSRSSGSVVRGARLAQLRNPLTVLRLRIEDLDELGGRREDRAELLAETDRFADVLDGLLALARAERGRTRPRRWTPPRSPRAGRRPGSRCRRGARSTWSRRCRRSR